jgi:hypothetical protein
MTDSSVTGAAVMDTWDVVFLGAIGLGTVAWLARKKLWEAVAGTKSKPLQAGANAQANGKVNAVNGIKKKERNFVKVMKEQVRLFPIRCFFFACGSFWCGRWHRLYTFDQDECSGVEMSCKMSFGICP